MANVCAHTTLHWVTSLWVACSPQGSSEGAIHVLLPSKVVGTPGGSQWCVASRATEVARWPGGKLGCRNRLHLYRCQPALGGWEPVVYSGGLRGGKSPCTSLPLAPVECWLKGSVHQSRFPVTQRVIEELSHFYLYPEVNM